MNAEYILGKTEFVKLQLRLQSKKANDVLSRKFITTETLEKIVIKHKEAYENNSTNSWRERELWKPKTNDNKNYRQRELRAKNGQKNIEPVKKLEEN